MPVLTPNDASILALIAQYPKRSVARRRQLEQLLGAEGKRVAEAMYSTAKGTRKSVKETVAQRVAYRTADLLRDWARGNRSRGSKSGRMALPPKSSGATYKIKMGDKRDWNIVIGEKPKSTSGKKRRGHASRDKGER